MKRFLKAQWPMLLIVGILLGCGVSQLADHSWMNAVSSFIMAGYAFLCAVLIDENNRLREAFHAQRKQVQE